MFNVQCPMYNVPLYNDHMYMDIVHLNIILYIWTLYCTFVNYTVHLYITMYSAIHCNCAVQCAWYILFLHTVNQHVLYIIIQLSFLNIAIAKSEKYLFRKIWKWYDVQILGYTWSALTALTQRCPGRRQEILLSSARICNKKYVLSKNQICGRGTYSKQ